MFGCSAPEILRVAKAAALAGFVYCPIKQIAWMRMDALFDQSNVIALTMSN